MDWKVGIYPIMQPIDQQMPGSGTALNRIERCSMRVGVSMVWTSLTPSYVRFVCHFGNHSLDDTVRERKKDNHEIVPKMPRAENERTQHSPIALQL